MEFFATSGSLPIHISDSKKGDKAILLLHGYLETLYIFDEFSEALQKEGFRVIAIDLPGHGLSGSNPEINTIEFAADTATDILKICGVEKAYIAGHCTMPDPDRESRSPHTRSATGDHIRKRSFPDHG